MRQTLRPELVPVVPQFLVVHAVLEHVWYIITGRLCPTALNRRTPAIATSLVTGIENGGRSIAERVNLLLNVAVVLRHPIGQPHRLDADHEDDGRGTRGSDADGNEHCGNTW